jgi:hypothetical protein
MKIFAAVSVWFLYFTCCEAVAKPLGMEAMTGVWVALGLTVVTSMAIGTFKSSNDA